MNPTCLSDFVRNEMEEHWPELLRFARSLTRNADLADDIAQESMVRALQRDQNLPEVANPRSWLFQIAANVFREWWRKNARQSAHQQQYANEYNTPPQELPCDVVEHREYLKSIWEFVQSLPPKQREMITMHLVDGLSQSEIAERMSTTTDNVKATLNVARTKLRQKFLSRE